MLRVTRLRLSCSGRMTDLPSHFEEKMYVRDYRIVTWAGIEPASITTRYTVAVRLYHLATMRNVEAASCGIFTASTIQFRLKTLHIPTLNEVPRHGY